MGEKSEKIVFVISRKERKLPHWFIIQNYWDWFKKLMPTTRILAPTFHEFCRILNWFCLLCHILRQKNINYAKFSYSDLQLSVYTAYRSLQKITNLMIRHLTRPYFLESCGSKVLFCFCYTTKKASRFRIKVANIILAETNAETFNTFIVHAISLKHML